jgi:hypothetical protein
MIVEDPYTESVGVIVGVQENTVVILRQDGQLSTQETEFKPENVPTAGSPLHRAAPGIMASVAPYLAGIFGGNAAAVARPADKEQTAQRAGAGELAARSDVAGPNACRKPLNLAEWHSLIVRAEGMLNDAVGSDEDEFVIMADIGGGRVTKFEEGRTDLRETRDAMDHLAFVAEKWMGMAATAAVTGDYIGGPREEIRDAAERQYAKSKSAAA